MIEVRSPADGRIVGVLREHSAAEVSAVAADLRSVQPEWEGLGPRGRGRHLLAWLDWFLDHERQLAELVQAESGKAWCEASLEPMVVVDVINYFTRHAAEFLVPRRVRPHSLAGVTKRLYVTYRPYPLVGLITPWNGPIGTPILDVVAALIPLSALLVGDIARSHEEWG